MTAVIILKDVPEPTLLCININLRWSLLYILRLINKKIGWGFCDIWNNWGWGKCYQPSRRPRQIALNKTLIIRISQKLNLIILLFYYKNKCLEENNKIHPIARNLTWYCYWKSCIAHTSYRWVSCLLAHN